MRLHRTLTPIVFIPCLLFWPALVQADFQAGMDAHNQGDYATAFKEWRPLAEGGNEKAQIRLGLLYFMGQGVPQDYGEALRWYRLAADQGKATAQSNLGDMYREGQGVPQDNQEAATTPQRPAPIQAVGDTEDLRLQELAAAIDNIRLDAKAGKLRATLQESAKLQKDLEAFRLTRVANWLPPAPEGWNLTENEWQAKPALRGWRTYSGPNGANVQIAISERDWGKEVVEMTAKLVDPDRRKANGIVNLTLVWQTGQHEKANTQLPTSPFSL